jgi:hypothetical protein
MGARPVVRQSRGVTGRDDFFTLIHKALRAELFAVAVEAGALDWGDERATLAFGGRWQALEDLLHMHSRHEDVHFFALAEDKAPGATSPLADEHEVLARALDAVGVAVQASVDGGDAVDVHRHVARFVGDYLPHLDTEERIVLPLLWATCSDAELDACRAEFMADVPPDVAAFSMRLMLPALAPTERAALLGRIRATAPAPVVEGAIGLAADVLSPDAYTRLLADLAS